MLLNPHDEMLMDIASVIADRSRDPHRQVGAIIALDDHIISYGWNGTPSGYHTNNCKDLQGNTLPQVVHAEANAIAKAARSTISCEGASMYSTTIPCIECAKLIAQSGIDYVYYMEDYNKCQLGRELLLDLDIKLIKLKD